MPRSTACRATLKDSGAEAIIILENFATTLQKVLDKTPVRAEQPAALSRVRS
jgi:long-chain acyl-CoA synthetase